MLNKIKNTLLNYRKRCNNEITYSEVKKIMQSKEDVYIIDVRSTQEYKEGHLPNSINISVYEIENKIEEYVKDKNTVIIVYCQMGSRGRNAMQKLEKNGYSNVYNLKGGLNSI